MKPTWKARLIHYALYAGIALAGISILWQLLFLQAPSRTEALAQANAYVEASTTAALYPIRLDISERSMGTTLPKSYAVVEVIPFAQVEVGRIAVFRGERNVITVHTVAYAGSTGLITKGDGAKRQDRVLTTLDTYYGVIARHPDGSPVVFPFR